MGDRPKWWIPPNFEALLADEGDWTDDRWAPVRLTVMSDTSSDSREVPLAWQIEFEPDDEIVKTANEKLGLQGFDCDGYGWGEYIRATVADASQGISESLHFGDCETTTCVVWTESQIAAKFLVEMLWQLFHADWSNPASKKAPSGATNSTNQSAGLQVSIMVVSYGRSGSHRALSGAWLAPLENPDLSFGSAVKEIAAYAWTRPRNGPKPNFESLYDRFEANFPSIPKIWFRRKKQLVEIAYATQIGTEEELLDDPRLELTPSLFRTGCEEIASILKLLQKSIKPSDDFDLSAFLDYSEQRLTTIPTDNESLDALFKRYQEFSKRWLTP